MTDVASWQRRLAAMDCTKAPRAKRREAAMLAEIGELRIAHMAAVVHANVQTRRADHWKAKAVDEATAPALRKELKRLIDRNASLVADVKKYRAKALRTRADTGALAYNRARVQELLGFTRKSQKQITELRK